MMKAEGPGHHILGRWRDSDFRDGEGSIRESAGGRSPSLAPISMCHVSEAGKPPTGAQRGNAMTDRD